MVVADIALEAKEHWRKAVAEICDESEQGAESVKDMLGEIMGVAKGPCLILPILLLYLLKNVLNGCSVR